MTRSTGHTAVQQGTQLFNRAHGCSTGHTDVQQGTRLFNRAQGWWTGHTDVQQGARMFNRVHGCSVVHTDVQQGTRTFFRADGCSTGHTAVQQGTRMFNRTHGCSTGHTDVQKSTRVVFKREHKSSVLQICQFQSLRINLNELWDNEVANCKHFKTAHWCFSMRINPTRYIRLYCIINALNLLHVSITFCGHLQGGVFFSKDILHRQPIQCTEDYNVKNSYVFIRTCWFY
jgi:hypothetical protein